MQDNQNVTIPNATEIRTQLLNQPLGTFKRFNSKSGGSLELSAIRFNLPRAKTIEVPAQGTIVLGRQADNSQKIDVDLGDFTTAEAGVSRTHAIMQITDSAVFIRDFESMNGVYLNGEELYPMRDYLVQDGDELLLGNFKIQVIFVA
jgi:pSer/pThr/pTyr-binding forkhead associated (FHA) protein